MLVAGPKSLSLPLSTGLRVDPQRQGGKGPKEGMEKDTVRYREAGMMPGVMSLLLWE